METVFHANKIQIKKDPFFSAANSVWPNTANIWLSEAHAVF